MEAAKAYSVVKHDPNNIQRYKCKVFILCPRQTTGHGGKKLKLLKLVIPFDELPKVFAFEVDEKFVFGVSAPSLETTLQVLI